MIEQAEQAALVVEPDGAVHLVDGGLWRPGDAVTDQVMAAWPLPAACWMCGQATTAAATVALAEWSYRTWRGCARCDRLGAGGRIADALGRTLPAAAADAAADAGLSPQPYAANPDHEPTDPGSLRPWGHVSRVWREQTGQWVDGWLWSTMPRRSSTGLPCPTCGRTRDTQWSQHGYCGRCWRELHHRPSLAGPERGSGRPSRLALFEADFLAAWAAGVDDQVQPGMGARVGIRPCSAYPAAYTREAAQVERAPFWYVPDRVRVRLRRAWGQRYRDVPGRTLS